MIGARANLLLGLVIVTVAVGGGDIARAQPTNDDPVAEAKRQVELGNQAVARKDYEGGIIHYRRADELAPSARLHFYIGEALAALGRNVEALTEYEYLLDHAPDAAEAEDAHAAIARLEPLVGSIAVDGAEPGATVQLDGRTVGKAPDLRPVRAQPGSHVIVVDKSGFERFRATVTVAKGRTVRVPVTLRPIDRAVYHGKDVTARPAARRSSRLSLLLGGAALALGGGAAGLALWGDATYERAQREPDRGKQLDLWHSANRKRYGAQAAGAVAIGCTGTAIWLYLRDRGKPAAEQPAARLQVAPKVAADAVGLALMGWF